MADDDQATVGGSLATDEKPKPKNGRRKQTRKRTSKKATSKAASNGSKRRGGRRAGELLAQGVDFKGDGTVTVRTNSGNKTIKFAHESMIVEFAAEARAAAKSYIDSLDL